MWLTFSRRAGVILTAVSLFGCAAQQHHADGLSAWSKQDYPRAVTELATASKLAPGDLEYRRDWLRAQEDATNALLTSADNSMAIGERAKSAMGYRSVLKYDTDNERALAGLQKLESMVKADEEVVAARAAFSRGELAQAEEVLAQALQRSPAHADALALRRELDSTKAQQSMLPPSLGAMYRKPINLEFRDASLKLVFDALSRSTGINFIFDRDVRPEQRTTVFLKHTSLDDAIDLILSTGQLDRKVLNASSVLIYPNTPAKVKEYQDLVVRAFYMANVEAKQTANMLKTVLKLKDIFIDDKYNMLVLRESPETISLAEKLVRLYDLEEPEVMLEVEVLEINRSRLLNAGVQWTSQFTVTPLGLNSSGPVSGTSTMKLSELRGLNSDRIGITVPSATINLQKSDGEANLLANPRIRVRDREKAKIMIGDKVPVVTTTSTNTFVTENIQYLDVGLKLEVEPDIHLRDEIGLKLALEVSSLVSSVKTNNGSQAYQIGTRNVSSALRLKDGETQILAGLISDEDRSTGNRVPLLGEFPLLGRLFGSQSDTRQKTEIVLSITPHLIRNIQRRDPSAESFWSGTEATLRDRPLQLRSMETRAASSDAPTSNIAGMQPASAVIQTPAAAPNAPRITLEGPESVKVGDVVKLSIGMDSSQALRAASLQVSYNPTEFELVALDDGGYFNKDGKGAFSKSIDAASGRAAIGGKSGDGADAKGAGSVAVLTLRAKLPSAGSNVAVTAMTPIGATLAVGAPALPVVKAITVTR